MSCIIPCINASNSITSLEVFFTASPDDHSATTACHIGAGGLIENIHQGFIESQDIQGTRTH